MCTVLIILIYIVYSVITIINCDSVTQLQLTHHACVLLTHAQITSPPCRGCTLGRSLNKLVVYLPSLIILEPLNMGSDNGDLGSQVLRLSVICCKLHEQKESLCR